MLTSFGNANAFYKKKINNSLPILAKTPKEKFQSKKKHSGTSDQKSRQRLGRQEQNFRSNNDVPLIYESIRTFEK